MTHMIFIAAVLALAGTLPAVPAQAAAPRTFVSAAGSDSNNCTNVATPCRHLAAAYAATEAAGRPALYLASPEISQEERARQIARADHITEGRIALFSATEPCLSYSVRGDPKTKHIHLVLETRKCIATM